VLDRITLAPYGSALSAMGKSNGSQAALWVRRVAPGAAGGTITLPAGALKPGAYDVRWWDTKAGRELSRESVTVAAGAVGATLKSPPVAQDIAVFVSAK
jgi:hypothetical protein